MAKRMIVLSLIVLLLISFIMPGSAAAASPAPAESSEGMPDALAAEGVSAESWAAMQAQIAAAEYHFTWQESGAGKGAYRAPNPALGLGVGFGPAGLRFWALDDWSNDLGFALRTVGSQSAALGAFGVDGGHVTRQGAGIIETLTNDEAGIHYALSLDTLFGEEKLDLIYQISGELAPQLSGASLTALDAEGHFVFQVTGLSAVDAAGQSYPVAFGLEDGILSVQVSDLAQAQSPLTIQMNLWTEGVKLTASDAGANDLFGYSVAVSGDVVVVGAYGEDTEGTDAGAAYVFQRMKNGADAWGEVIKLTAADAAANDQFGFAVAVSGDVIVVGAPYEDEEGPNAGAAYVFQRMKEGDDAWGEVTKLMASDAETLDIFGRSVAVSGDVIVVGAMGEDDEGDSAGAAYVFQRMQGGTDAWGQTARLTASDAAAYDFFGCSVAVSEDVIVVGADGEDVGGINAGAAYVFQRMAGGDDAWGEVDKLTASDAQADDHFGTSVAVSGDVIVVGAAVEDTGGTDAGAAYVFQRMAGGTDNWGQTAKLTASDAQADDHFGSTVAVSGDVIVVGAWGEDDSGADAGAAYIFHRRQGAADVWGEVDKLTASGPQAGDYFGFPVAVSEDVIVVGARMEDDGGTDAGAAYVFQDDAEDWRETTKNTASDASSVSWFGCSAAVSGDVLVVGAKRKASDTGAAYVFHRMQDGTDAWGEVVKLTGSDAATGDYFGNAVAVAGDVIVVGANHHDAGGSDTGAAYVYQRMEGGDDAWGEVIKLTASDAAANDQFGFAVAVSGDVIVVGAPYDSSYAGAVYVFQRMDGGADAWGEAAKLTASDAGSNDFFGWSVGVSGDVIVAGAWSEDAGGQNAGAAYVFQRMQGGADNWGEVTKLTASDAQPMDQFGYAAAISGDVIVVGARWEEEGGSSAGAAYVFQRMQGGADNWGQVAKLMASDPAENDSFVFGQSVAVSGDVIVVGAWAAESDGGSEAGAAYVFQRTQGGTDDWEQVIKLTAADTEAGDRFGWSVGISGDVIVVGAYGEDDGGSTAGASYIFQPDLAEADLSLTKTESSDPIYAGETLTYTLSVNNAGPSTAANLTVTDTLPASVTFQSASGTDWTCGEASGTVTCTRAALAVGAAPNIEITVTAPAAAGDITNQAAVTADTDDPDTVNNNDSTTTTVLALADLSLTKTDSPDPVYAGQALTYTLGVNNAGPSTAENLTVTDTLPAGVTYQSASGTGWTCSEASGVVICTRAALAVDNAPDITITVTAPAAAGEISNSAAVSADTYDNDDTNDEDSVTTTVTASADLSLTKTDSPDPVYVGETLTYTLSVSNAGPSTAANLTVTDTLPAGVTYQSASGTGWSCSQASGVVTCTRAALAVGNAPDITITVTAPDSSGDITNSAMVTANTHDPDSGNNTDDAITTLILWQVYMPLVLR